tara:strand:- start:9662 stop:9862 length:201 start_codon:yes stop_codon:yes gene_type:complete
MKDLKMFFVIGGIAAIISGDIPKGHSQVVQPAIQQGRLLAKNLINRINKKNSSLFVTKKRVDGNNW